MTKEIFLEKAKAKHGDLYDYSLVEDVKLRTTDKVKIICKEHGVFEQGVHHHVNRGQNCPKCKGKLYKVGSLTNDTFIERATKKHGNLYDYSLVDVNGKSINDKVEIICPIHGSFMKRIRDHYSNASSVSSGCPKCGHIKSGISKANTNRTSHEDIIKKCEKIHGKGKFDYSDIGFVENNKQYVNIRCIEHDIIFSQRLEMHTKGLYGCIECQIEQQKNRYSKGELLIRDILTNSNIELITQKTFNGCKNILPLKFDFYLPKYNMCIEYDGKQHYEAVDYFGGEKALLETQKRDKIKNEYCIDNNIRLLRIRYDEDINEVLSSVFVD